MTLEQTLSELVNPSANTAVSTLKARAFAGYVRAAQILERLQPKEDSAQTGQPDPKLLFVNALILEMRHVAMNRTILESGLQNVYDMPCGYTQRVFEMTDLGKRYIGGDLPLVIENIEPIIGELLGPDQKKLVSFANVDVTNYQSLEAAVADVDGPVCISTEGLSMYLNRDEKELLHQNIHKLLAKKGGCWLTADTETLSYYWAALLALSENEEEARQIYASIVKNFSSDSGTNLAAVNTDAGQIIRSGYADIQKHYEADGMNVELIPYYRDDFKLNLFAKMTPKQRERLLENLKNVHIWKITANPACNAEQTFNADAEKGKVYSEENCTVTARTVDSRLFVKLSGRLDTLSAPLFLKSWQEESASHEIREVEIDCRELEYISSAGLRVLLIIKKALPHSNPVLKNVTPDVKKILETSSFINLLEID